MLGFYIRPEGNRIRNGLNFYPLSDRRSAGFILRCGDWGFRMRYSKYQRRWIMGRMHRRDSEAMTYEKHFTTQEEDEIEEALQRATNLRRRQLRDSQTL